MDPQTENIPSTQTPQPVQPEIKPIAPPAPFIPTPTPQPPVPPPNFGQNPPPSSPAPQKPGSLYKLAIILLIFSVLIAAGYIAYNYLFKNQQLFKKQPQTSASPLPTFSPTPTADPTTNWILFKNDLYGFSFRHPNLCNNCGDIASPIQGKPEKLTVLVDKSTIKENSDAPFNGFGVFVEPNLSKKTLEAYINQEKLDLAKYYQDSLKENLKEPSQKEIIVAGQKGILLNYDQPIKNVYVLFPDKQKILVLAVIETTKTSFDSTLNQILSTFEFTSAIKSQYTCPANGYVDCMPVLDEAKKIACSDQAIAWYKLNCPNFKGGAL